MAWLDLSAQDAMISLLETERQLLLAGDLEALAKLADRKIALQTKLSKKKLDPELLDRIRRQARRNEILLQAALEGIKLASERVKAAHSPNAFSTYGRDGRSVPMSQENGKTFTRRA